MLARAPEGDDLEVIVKRAADFDPENIILFPVSGGLLALGTALWSGGVVDDFLKLYRKLGGGLLYVRRTPREDDVTKLARVELVFMHGGVPHMFRNPPLGENENDSHTRGRPRILEKARADREAQAAAYDKWAKDILGRKDELRALVLREFPKMQPPVELNSKYAVQARVRKILPACPVPNPYTLDSAFYHQVDSFVDQLVADATQAILATEAESVKNLALKFASWAEEKGLTRSKLSPTDLDVFLGQEKVWLSLQSRKSLLNEARLLMPDARGRRPRG